jgi:hypothetical protein
MLFARRVDRKKTIALPPTRTTTTTTIPTTTTAAAARTAITNKSEGGEVGHPHRMHLVNLNLTTPSKLTRNKPLALGKLVKVKVQNIRFNLKIARITATIMVPAPTHPFLMVAMHRYLVQQRMQSYQQTHLEETVAMAHDKVPLFHRQKPLMLTVNLIHNQQLLLQ